MKKKTSEQFLILEELKEYLRLVGKKRGEGGGGQGFFFEGFKKKL